MAITTDDFNKIWASASPLTPYPFSESQYKEGWNFIGSTPPSRQMWDFLQKNNDEKMQYLANNYLPLSGGTLTGVVNGVTPTAGDNSTKIATTAFVNAKAGNYLPLSGGTMTGSIKYVENGKVFSIRHSTTGNIDLGWSWDNREGAGLGLRSTSFSNPGEFRLFARDANNDCILTGRPDGTLTWNNQPLLPVGIVQAFAGTTIPMGWLLCDGSAVSRTTYANLYACIGTTYGAGDGSTTFNLPNLVDKFVEGSATAGTQRSAGLPNIKGTITFRTIDTSDNNLIFGEYDVDHPTGTFYKTTKSWSGAHAALSTSGYSPYQMEQLNMDASKSNVIYGNSTTVQPPALTMRYIIKY